MFYSAAKFECSPFFLLFVSSAGCGCCLTRHPLKLNLSVLKLFNGELRADSHFRAVVAAAPIVTFLPPPHPSNGKVRYPVPSFPSGACLVSYSVSLFLNSFKFNLFLI
jgi:hypothetical protein